MSGPNVSLEPLEAEKWKDAERARPARLNSGDFWLPGDFERALRQKEEQL